MSNAKNIFFVVLFIVLLPFIYKYGFKLSEEFQIDFPSFYFSAKAAFNDNFSPYDYELLVVSYPVDYKIFPFVYPPTALTVFFPFKWMSMEQAKVLFHFLSILCLFGSLYLLIFKIFEIGLENNVVYLLFFYFLSFQPIYLTLALGQINIVLLFSITLFWYCLMSSKDDWLSALPLAMSIIVKIYPIVFILYLIITRRYKTAAYAMGYICVFIILSVVMLPNGIWYDWIVNVLPSGGLGRVPYNLFSPAAPWNQSLNGFLSRLFFQNEFSDVLFPNVLLVRIIGYPIIGIMTFLLFKVIWTARNRASPELLNLEFCCILSFTFLVAPLSWEHHIVFLIPCVIYVLYELVNGPFRALSVYLIGLSVVLAWDLPLENKLFTQGIFTLIISVKFYAIIGLWLFLLWKLWKNSKYKGNVIIATKE